MVIKNSGTDEKLKLVKRNTVEVINENKISDFLKKGVVYCGYETSGEIHLGHLVTILKLLDLQKAGIKVKVMFADWHTWLNKKGDWKFVNSQVKQWEKGFKSLGLKAEFVRGTSFERNLDYMEDLLRLSLNITVNRGVRAMQQVARDVDNAKISQIIYPLMQITDVKALKVNFVLSGLDQRKIYMLGVDEGKEIGLQEAVYLFTPIIPSLRKSEGKMSSSVKESFISIRDTKKDIKSKINKAYCKPGDIINNSILAIVRLIVFPKFEKIEIKRSEKYGGNLDFDDYESLEESFESGKLHALDLKNSVSDYLEKIIAPIRKEWK
jgi:tyrosyl-tRNA synthetase